MRPPTRHPWFWHERGTNRKAHKPVCGDSAGDVIRGLPPGRKRGCISVHVYYSGNYWCCQRSNVFPVDGRFMWAERMHRSKRSITNRCDWLAYWAAERETRDVTHGIMSTINVKMKGLLSRKERERKKRTAWVGLGDSANSKIVAPSAKLSVGEQ